MWRRAKRAVQRSLQLSGLCLIVAAVTAAGFVGRGNGETVIPAQAVADDGAFLPYAPAPPQRAGLCLVDTGVNANSDTEGAVVERTAIDGGPGDDASPTSHGTVLAMMAAAPRNDWGMVGAAPGSVQIVSVRILEPEQSTVSFSSYAAGITTCLKLQYPRDIRVINLSLGNAATPSSEESEAVGNAVLRAANYGVAVVAAAGNDDGGPVTYPAAYPSVLSVGAGDTDKGGFCGFSNRGDGLRLVAPGCELDGADPLSGAPNFNYWQGTSEASAIASSALAALLAYRPGLSAQAGEEALTSSSGAMDVGRAFRDAGLGAIVTAGEEHEPHEPLPASGQNPPLTVQPSSRGPLTARFVGPRARLRYVRRRWVLTVTDRPTDAQLQVRLLARSRHSRRLKTVRTLRGTFSTLTLRGGLSEVALRFVDPYDAARASPWTTLRVMSAGAG